MVLFGLIILKKEFLPIFFPTKKAEISLKATKEIKYNNAAGDNRYKAYKEQYKALRINTLKSKNFKLNVFTNFTFFNFIINIEIISHNKHARIIKYCQLLVLIKTLEKSIPINTRPIKK